MKSLAIALSLTLSLLSVGCMHGHHHGDGGCCAKGCEMKNGEKAGDKSCCGDGCKVKNPSENPAAPAAK